MISSKTKERLIEAINGYGPVVGLRSDGPGEPLDSLPRIYKLLGALLSNPNPANEDMPLIALAAIASNKIQARESINGTPAEDQDRAGFRTKTIEACDAIRELRAFLRKI